MKDRRISDYVMTVTNRFGVKIANLLFFSVIARGLTVEEMTIYGLFFTSALLVSVFLDFGLRNSIAKLIGANGLDITFASFNTANIIFVFLSIAFVCTYVFTDGLFVLNALTPYSIYFLVTSLSMTYIRIIQSIFLGRGEVRFVNLSEAVPRTILICFSIYLLFIPDLTIHNAFSALMYSQIVGALYLFLFCLRKNVIHLNYQHLEYSVFVYVSGQI